MRHLSEEEMIDLLVGEDGALENRTHLADCPECTANLQTLERGWSYAKLAEPQMPSMILPPISYRKFKHTALLSRLAWVAAAAMFLLSFVGFRLELENGGMTVAFSILGSGTEVNEQRIAELEQRLVNAIEINAELAQSQLDARFAEIYQERDRDIDQFAVSLEKKMKEFELQSAQALVGIRDAQRGDR